jgi:hypothetical protein
MNAGVAGDCRWWGLHGTGPIDIETLQTQTEVWMGPKPADERNDHDLFRTELVNLTDQRHELVRLAELIDWQAFTNKWSPQFESTTGDRPCPRG